MRYYKHIDSGYIIAIGTGGGGTEITEQEYNTILPVIKNKPLRTDSTDYHLKENLTWEEYERPDDPVEPDPIDTDTAEKALRSGLFTMNPGEPVTEDYFAEQEEEPDYFEEG